MVLERMLSGKPETLFRRIMEKPALAILFPAHESFRALPGMNSAPCQAECPFVCRWKFRRQDRNLDWRDHPAC